MKFQKDLRWNQHVETIVNRSASTLSFIRRTIPPQARELRAKAYKQLVRPALEYACSVYDPLIQTLEDSLEAVQKRCARMVYNVPRISRISTTDLLNTLDWEPLAKRRAHRRLTLFRGMHFGEVATKITDYLVPATNHHRTRRHLLCYQTPHWNSHNHKRSFFISTATLWNALPTNSRLLCAPPD